MEQSHDPLCFIDNVDFFMYKPISSISCQRSCSLAPTILFTKSFHILDVTKLFSFLCAQYVVERHGNTLLPQYLGMYRLTVDGVQYYFVVMRNVFSSNLTIHR